MWEKSEQMIQLLLLGLEIHDSAQTFACTLKRGRRVGGVKQFLLPQISCVR